jgi:hypothetical protein
MLRRLNLQEPKVSFSPGQNDGCGMLGGNERCDGLPAPAASVQRAAPVIPEADGAAEPVKVG